MTGSFDWRFVAALLGLLAACTPTLDWREVRAEDDALAALFPCRPERHARTVPIAGIHARMDMAACDAGGSIYAISFVDVRDPTMVTGALAGLRSSAVGNVTGAAPQVTPFALRGMTPNAEATRLRVDGHLPNGTPVQEHAAFFVQGLRLYQASVIGAAPAPEAVETFFGGLGFPR
ncbi:MAG: hypothetical protein ABI156_10435 [Caldimonas sp.]